MNSNRILCSRNCLENIYALKKEIILYFSFLEVGGRWGGGLRGGCEGGCEKGVLCCSSFDVVHSARKGVESELICCQSHP